MKLFFKFAREIGGTKNVVVVVVVVVSFFYPFSSFSTQFPRLRSAFGLSSLGINWIIFLGVQKNYFPPPPLKQKCISQNMTIVSIWSFLPKLLTLLILHSEHSVLGLCVCFWLFLSVKHYDSNKVSIKTKDISKFLLKNLVTFWWQKIFWNMHTIPNFFGVRLYLALRSPARPQPQLQLESATWQQKHHKYKTPKPF